MKSFAFLVHPRADIARDMGRLWGPLGRVPDSAWELAMQWLPIPTIRWGTVHRPDLDDRVVGHILTVPVGARQMLTSPRTWTLDRIESAVDTAQQLGAGVVGLGALTAPVAGGGHRLRPRKGIGITNGNAFTAAMTHEGVRRLLPSLPTTSPTIAFVGATGSVGACVVELVAAEDVAATITLVARNRPRLDALAARVGAIAPTTDVRVATDIAAVRDADLVVVMTSAANALVTADHLKFGAIVLDDTQPRNTDPNLVTQRPDVTVVDGGMARVHGVDIRADIGDMPRGYAYACLCETMLLAFAGHEGNFCTGRATTDQARHMQALAADHSSLGFTLGDFLSFGRPVDVQPRAGHSPSGPASLPGPVQAPARVAA